MKEESLFPYSAYLEYNLQKRFTNNLTEPSIN